MYIVFFKVIIYNYVWSLYKSAAFLYVKARNLLQEKLFFNRFLENDNDFDGSTLGKLDNCKTILK